MQPNHIDQPARQQAPLLYRLALTLVRRRVRGSTRLLNLLQRRGVLDQPVDFRLGRHLLCVPISRNHYDQQELDTYEADLFGTLVEAAKALPQPLTLIDVGADIGLFSIKMLTSCPSIRRILAFEPNPEGYGWLRRNLSRLPAEIEAHPHCAAIADFQGRGRLGIPAVAGIESNHTQYFLEPATDGLIEVRTIDSLNLPAGEGLLIKIDVEGGELAALRGALQTIARAARAVVVLEAHPEVVNRTGIDPAECMKALTELRPFTFVAGETGQPLREDQPVFGHQLKRDHIYNVVGVSG